MGDRRAWRWRASLAACAALASATTACGLSDETGSCLSCAADASSPDASSPPLTDSGLSFFDDSAGPTDTGGSAVDTGGVPPIDSGSATGCTSAASCAPGSACNPTTGQCQASCNDDAACNGCCDVGLNCRAGTAADLCGPIGGECTSCSTMGTNKSCVNRACGCASAADCMAGQVCSGGRCGPCSNTAHCAAGDCCSMGACVDGQSNNATCGGFGECMMCGAGEVCTNGVCLCTTNCPVGALCTSSASCQSGSCQGNHCVCTAADQCPGGQVCTANGFCFPGPCNAGMCNGCCDGMGHCHASSAMTCGLGGAACQNCMGNGCNAQGACGT